jgi:transposase
MPQDYFAPPHCIETDLGHRMKKLYDDGMSANEIGKRYGFSEGAVAAQLRKQGTTFRRVIVSQEAQSEIIALYKAGQTQQVLADRFKVSRATIINTLRRHNQPSRLGGTPSPIAEAQAKEIVAAYEGGLSAVRIAPKYGVKACCILKVLHRMGATIRGPNEEKKGRTK